MPTSSTEVRMLQFSSRFASPYGGEPWNPEQELTDHYQPVPDRDTMMKILRAIARVSAGFHVLDEQPDPTMLDAAADLGLVDLCGRTPQVTELGCAILEAHLPIEIIEWPGDLNNLPSGVIPPPPRRAA